MSGAITWENLLKWDYAPLEDAYQEVSRRQMALEQAGDTCHATVFAFADEGEAADVLRDLVHDYRNRADRLEALLTDMMMALNHAAEEVEKVAEEALRLDAQAVVEGFAISGAVRVSSTSAVSKSTDMSRPYNEGDAVALDSRRREFESDAQALLDRAQDIADRLVRAMSNIEQDKPSSAASMSADSFIPRSNVAIVDAMKELPAAQVRAYWESLDAGRQQHLIREFPEIVGNLSGIPFPVRVKANERTAQNYIDRIKREHPNLESEIASIEAELDKRDSRITREEITSSNEDAEHRLEELKEIRANLRVAEGIAAGDQAILFDPDNDRVVMANGDVASPPDHAAIFVPGTGTNMESFANGITSFGDGLVTALDRSGQDAVVFTIKDGPWSTWVGDGANSVESEMAERADKVQRLAEDMLLEDYGEATEYVGIGHSAGETKLSISEAQGVVYDENISGGGSYVGNFWVADPRAEYTHIQYRGDAINILDGFGYRTPHKLTEFENVIIPVEDEGMFGAHTKISEGYETNREGIEQIADEIED